MSAETRNPRAALYTRRFAAAIFDFDETIIDLEPQHTDAHAALCRDYGVEYEQMPESFRKGSGRRIIDDIREMRAHFGWTASEEELFEKRQQHFDRICTGSQLTAMDGVRELLEEVHGWRIPMAIASSAVGSSIDAILRRLGLRHFFTLIVDGSDVTNGKPDPEAYLVTARKLGVPPHQCIVFEDSHVGVLAAKRAGMFCVGVRNPKAQETQDLSDADIVVSSARAFTGSNGNAGVPAG